MVTYVPVDLSIASVLDAELGETTTSPTETVGETRLLGCIKRPDFHGSS